MNTRRKETSGPLSQARYMSSNEFAELRGVSGVAVSARAAILLHAARQNFIWFLQSLSLADGGFKRVARELVEMFPDRLGTPEMHKVGVRPEKVYHGKLFGRVQMDFGKYNYNPVNTVKGACLIEACRDAALANRQYGQSQNEYSNRPSFLSLEEFLIDLCINPRIQFSLPGEDSVAKEIENELAIEKNPELSESDFKTATLIYFRDIIGTLVEYNARRTAKISENFYLTAIGKKVWDTLDYALKCRGMVLLDGLEGRGKTEAVKAWCELHLGTARFVSLKGITSKTTAFREIAKALGIASSYTRTATEMQARIEDVLKRSKLMLVIDEAHFLFNQSSRMYSRPELIDWIDTAVCNCGIPIALVTTPQFIVCMTRAADQVEWNYRQFRRRVKRWVKLPEKNSESDITGVARSVFQTADEGAIKKIVGYSLLSKRDVSGVGDVASEVRVMLGTEDLSATRATHVHRAITDFLLPGDETFAEGMAAVRKGGRKIIRKAVPVILSDDVSETKSVAEPQQEFDRTALPPAPSRARGRSTNAAELMGV
ncbi:MAG TPA: ATP-binding protein [Verrucomicrobiae bacterium]|jgi:hypothetical protein